MRTRTALALLVSVALAQLLLSSGARAQPAHVGYVESTVHPIRVHYPTASATTMAQAVLEFAEQSWDVQIDQMGFTAPKTVDASDNTIDALWIYLVSGDSGTSEPIGDVPGTSWTDCTTRVLIPVSLQPSLLEIYVYHEMNHALQMSMDCTEAYFAYENTTNAVTAMLFPSDILWTQYFLPTFQTYPHAGLDCTFFGDQNRAYYHYGAALFEVFLEEMYGDADGTMLSRFWEAARQDGTVTVSGMGPYASVPNEPDLLDAMQTVLGELGVDLGEAFAAFARWRYFVGDRDDGNHFENADHWVGSEVAVAQEHVLAELPILMATPDVFPMDYGTVYVELDLDGLDSPNGIVFSFDGTSAVRWHVDALAVANDFTAEVTTMELAADGTGELPLAGITDAVKVVFVISALGGETHEADSPNCQAAHGFSYGLRSEDLETMPIPDTLVPNELAPGETLDVVVEGVGFMNGLTAELTGTGVRVTNVVVVNENTLNLTVTADATAPEESCDLVLTNPNGQEGLLIDAVSVVVAPDPKSGCGCNTDGSGAGGGALLFGLLVLLFIDWRRPRGPLRGRPR
ncbi:MAG: MYXO-CTERM sorting domain-containing protein [bacterium]